MSNYIFFDGSCGLCHWFVRFILKKMSPNFNCVFSPLGGIHFNDLSAQHPLPKDGKSIVVFTQNDEILSRGKAIIYILKMTRSPWPFVAKILSYLPSCLVNALYFCVTRMRYVFKGKKANACPIDDLQMVRKHYLE